MKNIFTAFGICFHAFLFSQSNDQLVLQSDSIFWEGYNRCNWEMQAPYVSNDLEFYHDQGGMMKGVEALRTSLKNNICGNPTVKVTRKIVAGSLQYFPLYENKIQYGAILLGEHQFYQNEILTGIAKFNHLWLLENNSWKMKRILSFDHKAVSKVYDKFHLDMVTLKSYEGNYQSRQFGNVIAKAENNEMFLSVNGTVFKLIPHARSEFHMENRNLIFQFIQGEKIIVLENGKIADELSRVK